MTCLLRLLESVRYVSDPFQDEAVDGTSPFTKPEFPCVSICFHLVVSGSPEISRLCRSTLSAQEGPVILRAPERQVRRSCPNSEQGILVYFFHLWWSLTHLFVSFSSGIPILFCMNLPHGLCSGHWVLEKVGCHVPDPFGLKVEWFSFPKQMFALGNCGSPAFRQCWTEQVFKKGKIHTHPGVDVRTFPDLFHMFNLTFEHCRPSICRARGLDPQIATSDTSHLTAYK